MVTLVVPEHSLLSLFGEKAIVERGTREHFRRQDPTDHEGTRCCLLSSIFLFFLGGGFAVDCPNGSVPVEGSPLFHRLPSGDTSTANCIVAHTEGTNGVEVMAAAGVPTLLCESKTTNPPPPAFTVCDTPLPSRWEN
ncbi:unnamed protein product [Discosporangium mesarthrocarpum]